MREGGEDVRGSCPGTEYDVNTTGLLVRVACRVKFDLIRADLLGYSSIGLSLVWITVVVRTVLGVPQLEVPGFIPSCTNGPFVWTPQK